MPGEGLVRVRPALLEGPARLFVEGGGPAGAEAVEQHLADDAVHELHGAAVVQRLDQAAPDGVVEQLPDDVDGPVERGREDGQVRVGAEHGRGGDHLDGVRAQPRQPPGEDVADPPRHALGTGLAEDLHPDDLPHEERVATGLAGRALEELVRQGAHGGLPRQRDRLLR